MLGLGRPAPKGDRQQRSTPYRGKQESGIGEPWAESPPNLWILANL